MSATTAGLVQLGVLLVLLAVVYVPFGNHLAAVYTSGEHWRVERAVYRVVGVAPDAEQRWSGYATALLAFSFLSVVLLYLLQRLQGLLPLGLGRGPVEPGIAFNTAVSFVTNTNWQSYVPETVMGHLVQMAGLTVQNFVSAAVGMGVAAALVRGFVRHSSDRIGNFWVDLVRGTFRVLLPISFVAAVVLVALGVDTKAVSVPEAGHLALARAYEPLARAYADGRPDGVGAWIRHCADAYARGAEAGLALAEPARASP